MAGKAAAPPVPKFGSWDAENIGYTVFFEKVRENKGTPAPAAAAAPAPASRGGSEYDFDPYEHYENLSRKAASRPPSSYGHGPAPPQHPAQRGTGYHRRNGSNGSNPASEASSRGSKFSPPRPYQPRYGDNSYPPQQSGGGGSYGGGGYAAPPAPNSYPAHQGGRGGGYNAGAYAAPPPSSYPAHQGSGGGAYNAGPAPNSYPAQQGDGSYSAAAYASPSAQRHNYQHAAAPRAAASPPQHAPPPVNNPNTTAGRPPKASAVPKFGVWDEQNSTGAAHGFTVQFDKVKRNREVAKTAAPDVPPQLISPEQAAPTWQQQRPHQRTPRKSFASKMCGCLFPKVREVM